MKPKSTLILDNEFIQYCELNKITNIDKTAKDTFNRGFSLLKYGETPFGDRVREVIEVSKEVIKEIIVEKIVERIVEVPIEVIKEVIKEVEGPERIRREEVIKYIEQCPVPKEIIDLHNAATELNKATEGKR